ncbi:phage antirepressor N-terminal domain-containing protein [Paraburkholderia tropica]|uniref:phage antirepressor N-terminal domain-containing protein n=1 Tax=Paraburkholderia tropica TaxID=92647 RepID=UPI002AB18A76|nr:phage antirepressor N-terminal domain-containing protein [Paraburkholderia tropica]
MSNSSTSIAARQVKVPFHGAELYVVEHNGQPYTPMKPIVDAMGLDWKSQHAKLAANDGRWGMVIITIPSAGGLQQMAAIPLRKLFGWLASIHVGKIRAALRETVARYQNECDDVLWQYWNDGIAMNPRMAFSVNAGDVLTGDQQETLRLMVKTLVERLPKSKQGGAATRVWSKLKAHFKVPYRQIPQIEFTEAVSIVTRTAAEWEVVEPEPEPGTRFAVPGHGRYLVVASHLGSYVYNLGSFSIVASDEARRLQLEMLALSEDLARTKNRLSAMLADGKNTVFRPVADGLRLM